MSESNYADSTEVATSAFKRSQAKYKRRATSPDSIRDLDEMLDFSRPDHHPRIRRIISEETDDLVYTIDSYQGFLYFPGALHDSLVMELAYQAVSNYCEPDHRTNIDGVLPKESEIINPTEKMWELWKASQTKDSKPNRYRCFQKLTWSTMGYHYDWTARTYRKDRYSKVPHLIHSLGCYFATRSLTLLDVKHPSFRAEAVICNYYHKKSLMGGHRDDLEFALDKPIVSLSMGRPAVFLLGGDNKDVAPLPILIRPGDVMVMAGSCRLCYHGMARLLPTDKLPTPDVMPSQSAKVSLRQLETQPTLLTTKEEQALVQYLQDHRININIRQVFVD